MMRFNSSQAADSCRVFRGPSRNMKILMSETLHCKSPLPPFVGPWPRGLFMFPALAVLLLLFQNCERPYDLKVSSNEGQAASVSVALLLNDGAGVTRDPLLKVSLDVKNQSEMYMTLDPACDSGGQWEPFLSETEFNLPGDDELKTVYAKFRDAKQKETECFSASILLDTHPPVMSLPESPASISKASDAVFALAATDALSGVARVECRFNAEEFRSCPSSVKKADFVEGTQVFQVRGFDRAGNMSEILEFRWLIDRLAPTITILNKPNAYTQQTSAVVAFNSDDSGSKIDSIKCRLDDGALAECVSPVTFPVLGQGKHSFKTVVSDRAGNLIEKTVSWHVDTIAPTLVVSKAPEALSRDKNPYVSFSATDTVVVGSGIDRFACQLDAGTVANCTSPLTLKKVPDGPHTIRIAALDRAANMAVEERTFFVDDTPPTITVIAAPSQYLNSTTAEFSLLTVDPNGGNGSGLESLMCKLDNGALQACGTLQVFNDLAQGSHAAVFALKDRAGNTTTRFFPFVVDNVAPSIPIFASRPADSSNAKMSRFTYSSTDGTGSGIQSYLCQLDNGPTEVCGGTKTYNNLPAGLHSFSVRASDKAGNSSLAVIATWTIVP